MLITIVPLLKENQTNKEMETLIIYVDKIGLYIFKILDYKGYSCEKTNF